jgi:hypothetical protein
MKIICVNNTEFTQLITIGKLYDSIEHKSEGIISIIGDDGYRYTFFTHRFITLDLHRENKLNTILND